ncbi:C40 family peptidase [Nocardioides sp.]|uniref:C40 family peptidase n=1 Tax=Nocardioides sp. TaxID=35761 RepID=UPI002B273608|nr:NlpC/P60 family protein [Nocardioides sp.]
MGLLWADHDGLGQAGVSLPHSSGAQYSSGPRVAASDLRPGDLVFYYSPISHVGMYIGNGNIVHAANPSTGVQVTGLYSMPYVGAVRPG